MPLLDFWVVIEFITGPVTSTLKTEMSFIPKPLPADFPAISEALNQISFVIVPASIRLRTIFQLHLLTLLFMAEQIPLIIPKEGLSFDRWA